MSQFLPQRPGVGQAPDAQGGRSGLAEAAPLEEWAAKVESCMVSLLLSQDGHSGAAASIERSSFSNFVPQSSH